jgi:hypothetical protein
MFDRIGEWLVRDFGVFGAQIQVWMPIALFALFAAGMPSLGRHGQARFED